MRSSRYLRERHGRPGRHERVVQPLHTHAELIGFADGAAPHAALAVEGFQRICPRATVSICVGGAIRRQSASDWVRRWKKDTGGGREHASGIIAEECLPMCGQRVFKRGVIIVGPASGLWDALSGDVRRRVVGTSAQSVFSERQRDRPLRAHRGDQRLVVDAHIGQRHRMPPRWVASPCAMPQVRRKKYRLMATDGM